MSFHEARIHAEIIAARRHAEKITWFNQRTSVNSTEITPLALLIATDPRNSWTPNLGKSVVDQAVSAAKSFGIVGDTGARVAAWIADWISSKLAGTAGSGGGGGADPGGGSGAPCIFPAKIDPVTNTCKIFVGSGSGPEGRFGAAVAGAFGIPAMQPAVTSPVRRRCPPSMVLGRDNLCYPSAVLRRSSRFRKWRPGMRPLMTGGDRRAITKAKSAVTRTRAAMKSIGVTVPKR